MGDGKDRSLYQREYYLAHKAELARKRKEAYDNDEEHRERLKEASRSYRERKKAEIERRIQNGELPPPRPKVRKPRPNKSWSVVVNGTRIVAFTIPQISRMLGRSRATVYNWIRIGAIPDTPFISKRGFRLYTDEMVEIIRGELDSRSIIGRDPSVHEAIEKGWAKQGVYKSAPRDESVC